MTGGTVNDYLSLTKPRITLLVLATTAAGFWLGSAGALDPTLLVRALVGTALVAAGTSAMNQVLERDVDALMARTRARPLPAGRLGTLPAAVFAGALAAGGVAYLALTVNFLTAILAAAAFLIYDLAYTPLKRVHPLCTLVGAVPGALPIAGGWTAATGRLDAGAWALFAILFLWQLPHFLALAWLYREDYREASLRMLSVDDPEGRHTRHRALTFTLALLPVSLVPSVLGLAGPVYFGAALLLGGAFLVRAAIFFRSGKQLAARKLFRYSLVYLPLLLAVLSLDGRSPASSTAPSPASEAPEAAAVALSLHTTSYQEATVHDPTEVQR